MATKAELEAQLTKRDEPPATWPTAVAGPTIVTGALLGFAILYLAAKRTSGPAGTFPPELMTIPVIVAWVIAFFTVKTYLTPRVYGSGPVEAAQALAAVAGGTAAVWLVWTGRAGPVVTWPWLCMWWGCVTLWWSAILWTADRRLDQGPPVTVSGDGVDMNMPWPQLLERATDGRVVLTDVKGHRAGATLTVETGRFTDDDGNEYDEAVTFTDFAACADRFASLAAREFRRRNRGQKMPVNSTRPEQGGDDSEFLLHVTLQDVFGEDAAFVPAAGPQDITKPLDMGEYEDAQRVLLTVLYLHSKIVGVTGSGKSVEANNWIARITECSNALVWVGATDKLIPLVFPWLKPFFAGRTGQPVLDWVAGQHIDQVLDMLAAGYKLCCERNARLTDEPKLTPTAEEPAVFIFVEETSHTMEFHDTIETHDGITANASKLIMLITRAGRSAMVQVVILSQTALNGAVGDDAAEIVRNLTIRVCLKTNEGHDGWRTITALDGVNTTKLTNHMKIVQPDAETPRAMPAKAAYLDGTPTIEPVALRNSAYRPVGGVEAESDLGPEYLDRWNPRKHPELTRALARHGLRWRIPDALVGAASTAAGTTNEETDMNRWTRKDDDAVYAEAAASHGHRGPGVFIPGGDAALAKVEANAQDFRDNPLVVLDAPVTDAEREWVARQEVGEEPAPLPPTLKAIVAWFDAEEEVGGLAEFYLTETLAAGIGHPNPAALGREIWREARIRSRQATAAEGGGGRKGYDTRELDEAAKRIQFGL